MYVIKDDNDAIIADGKGRKSFNSLAVIFRPDGGQTSNAKVDEPLHDEDGKKLFIREVVIQPEPDNNFYTSTLKEDGSWNKTDKDLDVLKSDWTSRTKETAKSLLSSSDWQVIAKEERDRGIDSDVATYRAAVISKCTEIETSIKNCSDLDAFKKLFDVPEKGNAPIYDWPDNK